MKMLSHFHYHPLALSLLLFLGNLALSPGAPNLLTDPGFESGSFAANPNLGWGPVNAAAISHDYVHTGLWSLKDHYDTNGIGPVVAGTQIVPAVAGATYALSSWAFTPAALNSSRGMLLVDFQDSNQQFINYNGTVFYTLGALDSSSPALTWTFLSGSVTAPPGTVYVQVLAELFNVFSGSPSDVVYYDDLTLTQVPEPTVSALAALGLTLIAFRRRRPNN
jgi:hypothetical protein